MHRIYPQNLASGKKKEGNHSNISDNSGIHPKIRKTNNPFKFRDVSIFHSYENKMICKQTTKRC